MATFVTVEDPADDRLADYVRLRDMQLRKSLEAEHGLFIAEGAVKVSMGSVLTMPYTRIDDWHGAADRLREHGFRVVALTPDADAVPIERAWDAHTPTGTDRVALLLGSEGHGLSERWLRSADVRARIPMAPVVDSLNVAACCAIACYALRRPDSRHER